MLVLSRYPGQSIVIDHNIVVRVIEFRDGKVRLGIDAPDDVAIHREEVQRRIDRELREELGDED